MWAILVCTQRKTHVSWLSLLALSLIACSDSKQAESSDLSAARQALTSTVSFQNGSNGYTGMIDAEIRQISASTNLGNNSTCDVDGVDGSGYDRSCLMRWDISAIPTGATIQAAKLTLRATNGTSNTYSLFALNRSWNESTVTWNKTNGSTSWGTAGALASSDRGSVVGSVSGSGTLTVTLNANGIAIVQSWVNGATNAGFLIANSTNTDNITFASSEYGTVSYRPKLTVTYVTADTSGSGGAGAGGAAAGGAAAGGAATGGAATGGAATGGAATGGEAQTGGAATGGTETGGNATGGVQTGGATTGGSTAGTATEPELLVAFLGDQGLNTNADNVLNLIRSEGAAAVVHNGDFDYLDSPSLWNARIDAILGANFPYFAVVGNHDAAAWDGASGYASFINARMARVPEMQCTGDVGVKATCRFRGLYMVQSCVGTSELAGHGDCGKDSAEQTNFIRDSLAADRSLWSLCLWHKNQSDMQIGTKADEVGWNAYKECMNGGAIIATAHEHSYSRTVSLTNLGNGALGHGAIGSFDTLSIAPGQTFVFVSGLGGNSVRSYDSASHNDDTWWASQYASNRWMKSGVLRSGTGTYGALFIRFNVSGNPKLARGYFKDVNGRVADEYTVTVP